MSPLRPVKSTYTPKYPRRLTDAELRAYLRPGLARRFSNETLVLSTLLVGSTLASCAKTETLEPVEIGTPHRNVTPSGKVRLPMMGKSTRIDPTLKKKVDRIIAEVLGRPDAEKIYRNSEFIYYRLIADNAMIKVPVVQVMFGNSIMGIFNVEEARKATEKLFAAYGIELEENVYIAGDGYEFEADGFNTDYGVGFEIRSGDESQLFPWDPHSAEMESGEDFLGRNELVSLEKDINRDRIDLFVCDPHILYRDTLRFHYLSSVVDYLNWIHGDREIEYRRRAPMDLCSFRPGSLEPLWEASPGEAEGQWAVDGVIGGIGDTQRALTLTLDLKPGATATYSPMEPLPYGLAANPPWINFVLAVHCVFPDDIPVDIDLYVNGEPSTRIRKTFLPGGGGLLEYEPDHIEAGKIDALAYLEIINVNRFPIKLTIARIEKVL